MLLITVFGVLSNGCPLPYNTCQRDIFCDIRPMGMCIPYSDGNGYCAYPASDCTSMWRWSDLAKDPIRDECVDPALIPRDAGSGDMADM